jgi:hypothetical protein
MFKSERTGHLTGILPEPSPFAAVGSRATFSPCPDVARTRPRPLVMRGRGPRFRMRLFSGETVQLLALLPRGQFIP